MGEFLLWIFNIAGFAVLIKIAWWLFSDTFGKKPMVKPVQLMDSKPARATVSNAPPSQQADCSITIPRRKPRSSTALGPMLLVYTNTSNQTHKRHIQPYRARAKLDYFDAYCFTQKTPRSFRFDQTHHAIDLSTGEVFSQAGLYQLIHPKRTPPEWLETEPHDVDTVEFVNNHQ